MFDVFYSKGPTFLLYYLFLCLFFTVSYVIYRNNYLKKDGSRSLVDTNTDNPYLLAYLQGGEVVVMKLAIWSLSLKKCIKLQYSKSKTNARYTFENTTNGLDPVESLILSFLEKVGVNGDFKEYLLSETIRKEVDSHILERFSFLEQSNLYLSETKKAYMNKVRSGFLFVIIGVAVIKVIIALNTGHSNVFFLILLCIGFVFLITKLKKKKPLPVVQDYIVGLKDVGVKNSRSEINGLNVTELLLRVSIYGISILEGTIYSDFSEMLKNQKSKSSTDNTLSCMSYCYIGCSCSFYSSSSGGCSSCSSCSGGSSCSSCSSCGGCGGCGD